jgi:hypothetical protein
LAAPCPPIITNRDVFEPNMALMVMSIGQQPVSNRNLLTKSGLEARLMLARAQ